MSRLASISFQSAGYPAFAAIGGAEHGLKTAAFWLWLIKRIIRVVLTDTGRAARRAGEPVFRAGPAIRACQQPGRQKQDETAQAVLQPPDMSAQLAHMDETELRPGLGVGFGRVRDDVIFQIGLRPAQEARQLLAQRLRPVRVFSARRDDARKGENGL